MTFNLHWASLPYNRCNTFPVQYLESTYIACFMATIPTRKHTTRTTFPFVQKTYILSEVLHRCRRLLPCTTRGSTGSQIYNSMGTSPVTASGLAEPPRHFSDASLWISRDLKNVLTAYAAEAITRYHDFFNKTNTYL